MDRAEKIERFYNEQHQFKDGVHELRLLVLKCGLIETYKWSFPTYTFDNKNIVAISKFKTHFGIWFFNGVFLSDPMKILENAQEGKTKAMRHCLQFSTKKKKKEKIMIPTELMLEFDKNNMLKNEFEKLSYSKQKEYTEYITLAKQEKTKLSRLIKIIPLILNGKGLNDHYRK